MFAHDGKLEIMYRLFYDFIILVAVDVFSLYFLISYLKISFNTILVC